MNDKVTGTFSILVPKRGKFWAFVRWLASAITWIGDRLDCYGYEVERKVYLHDENMEFIDESCGK